MLEVSAGVENIKPEVDIIGRTAYLREDITISDVIVQTAAKPYYTESASAKQDRTYSPAPGIKIRFAISVVIATVSCCLVFLAEFTLPVGCMAEPLSWGGVSRFMNGEASGQRMAAKWTAQNLITEIQVPIVASCLVHVIMRTEKYNVAIRLAVLCAVMAWLGSACNAFVWSPSFLNCESHYLTRKRPGPNQLGFGTLTQSICSGCFSVFAVRRLLLLEEVVNVFPGYAKCIKVLIALSAVSGVSAVGVRESFGRTVAGVLYYAAGAFLLCTLALAVALFSKLFRTLGSAELSVVDSAMNAQIRIMTMLKWERLCISCTLLTMCACVFFTGTMYFSSSLMGRFGPYKYVVYSVDTMVNACCFAYLMFSSERRLAGFCRVQNSDQ